MKHIKNIYEPHIFSYIFLNIWTYKFYMLLYMNIYDCVGLYQNGTFNILKWRFSYIKVELFTLLLLEVGE